MSLTPFAWFVRRGYGWALILGTGGIVIGESGRLLRLSQSGWVLEGKHENLLMDCVP